MKVSEAKEKTCPFIQDAGILINDNACKLYNTPANIQCICGDCMAWSFINESYDDGGVMRFRKSETEGYCERIGQ